MTSRLEGVRLPEEAVPRCPDCGRVLVPWVRDDTFLEDLLKKRHVNFRENEQKNERTNLSR